MGKPNPILLNLVKGYMPQILSQIESLEIAIIAYLNTVNLEEGETHCTAFFEIDGDEEKCFIVIGAFTDRTFVRAVEVKPLAEFLKEMLTKIF